MTPPALRIRLLGNLEVVRREAAVALPASKRTRALLGYLVASRAPQSRAALCDLLWDGPDDPRAALRWSLTKLRTVLGDDSAPAPHLLTDRERVAFAAHDAAVDVDQLRQRLEPGVAAASIEALEQAAQLLRGEFLDGIELPACYRFHHWCMAERERYGTLRRAVLDALAARLDDDPARALLYARAMLDADPLAESAHATLLRLLGRLGRYPDAESHYAYARELLRREVSASAGGPLDEAIRGVRRDLQRAGGARGAGDDRAAAPRDARTAAPRDAPAAGAPRPGGADEQHAGAPALRLLDPTAAAQPDSSAPRPLVGRDAERRVVERALAALPAQPRPLLLFVGEPGIGKTRLLEHFAQAAQAAGCQVLRGRCYEAEMVRPYGLWLDALRGVAADAVPGEMRAAAAPLLDTSAEPRAGEGRARLFDAAAALVGALAASRPLAFALDDLQWLDEASAALLHFLLRAPVARAPVIFAGAARAGEVDDNRWTKGLLQSLVRADRLQRHDVGPLAAADVAALLAGSPAAADIDRALRDSGGNPLYVLELARAGAQGSDGTGRSLDDLIGAQLLALDDGERDLLAWAAASGRELRPELLADAAGWTPADLLRQLERLERRGLLRTIRDGQIDFAHDLVRQAVYRGLSQPRRRAIHRQLARALGAASPGEPRLAGEVVHHASLAGDVPTALRACLAAGEHCLRVYANAEAVAVAERGLAQAPQLPHGSERVRLVIALLKLRIVADASPAARRLPALVGQLERAIEAADALALHAEAASALHILSWLHQQANDIERARTATLAAERYTRKADAATRCQQLANTGRCLLEVEADLPRARELLAQAAALAATLELEPIELLWGQGLIARAGGDLAAGQHKLARAVTLAELRDDHWREFECRVWLATIELERGCFDAVLEHCDNVVRVAERMGDASAPFAAALHALAEWRREPDAEPADLDACLLALRAADDKAHLAYALNTAAAIAFECGRYDAARAWAEEALVAAGIVRRTTEIAVARATLAALDATRGDTVAAQRRLHELPHGSAGDRCSARAGAAIERAHAAVARLAAPPTVEGESP